MKMKHPLLIITFLIITQATVSFASIVSPVENEMLKHIHNNITSSKTLLTKVVNINSGTMNFPGVRKVGAIFAKEFKSLGFKTRWIDGKSFKRAGHLLAEYGNTGPKILLIGHLDTVFAKDSKNQKIVRIDDRYLKGPGITDMKGGDVIIVAIMKALKETNQLQKFSFKILLLGDEEKRGRPLKTASSILLESGRWADVALGFEDGDGNPETAVISRRGSVSWILNVTGAAAHSSQIFQPDKGDGAIFEAARILNTFREQLQHEENLTFNPGLILGGTTIKVNTEKATGNAFGKNNVIAQTTFIAGDLRAISPQQLLKTKNLMKKIVAGNLNKTTARITFGAGYPPMAATAGNRLLLEKYSRVSENLGFGKVSAVNPRNAGAADISFVAADVCMALDGLGLMGTGGHTVAETADMNTLESQIQKAAILITRLVNLPARCSQE